MLKQSIAIKIIVFTVLWVGLLAADLAAPCWAASKVDAQTTLTMEINNEPLRSVLGKITKKSGWKIKVPDAWLDKPVTQTLHKATLEEGVRFVLRNAGIENLLLMYDENIKVVTVFDTDSAQLKVADSKPTPAEPQATPNVSMPPVISSVTEPDHTLERATERDARSKRRSSREARRQSSGDD